MKRIGYWTSAAILLFSSGVAHAVNGTLSGGSGLIVMRTAETLNRGAAALSDFRWADMFRESDSRYLYTAIQDMPELSYGLVNNVEVGVMAPFLLNTDSSSAGLNGLHGYVKYRFIHAPKAGVGVAVTVFGSTHNPANVRIGSGKDNYGVELNVSLPRLLEPAGVFHATVGLEKTDTEDVSDGLTYERVIKKKLDIGVEAPPMNRVKLSVEFLLTRWSPSRTNLLLLPGLRYEAAKGLDLIVAAGIGVPRHQNPPGYRFIGGISYVFGGAGAAPQAGAKKQPATGSR